MSGWLIKNKQVKTASKVQPPKITKQQKNKKKRSYSTGNSSRMLASLKNVQTIEITKDDFLGGQIIGN